MKNDQTNNIENLIKYDIFMKVLIFSFVILFSAVFNIDGAGAKNIKPTCLDDDTFLALCDCLRKCTLIEKEFSVFSLIYSSKNSVMGSLIKFEADKNINRLMFLRDIKASYLQNSLNKDISRNFISEFNRRVRNVFSTGFNEKVLQSMVEIDFKKPRIDEIIKAGLDAFMLPEPEDDSSLPVQRTHTFSPAPAAAAKVDSLEALVAGVVAMPMVKEVKDDGSFYKEERLFDDQGRRCLTEKDLADLD